VLVGGRADILCLVVDTHAVNSQRAVAVVRVFQSYAGRLTADTLQRLAVLSRHQQSVASKPRSQREVGDPNVRGGGQGYIRDSYPDNQ